MSGPDIRRRFLPRTALGALVIAGGLTVAACGTAQDEGVRWQPVDCNSGVRKNSQSITVFPGQTIQVSDKKIAAGTTPGEILIVSGNESSARPIAPEPGGFRFESTDRTFGYSVSGSPTNLNNAPATRIEITAACK